MNARENIALIGFMGTGKSSVGRLVARKLQWRFADTDQIVEKRAGRSISSIFADDGEPLFREQERAALEALRDEDGQVIATGGGIVTRAENVQLLREIAFVVWLTADEETIFERVSRNAKRPLLQTPNPRETVATLLHERRPFYATAAHCTVDTTHRTHGEIANCIIAESNAFFAPSRAARGSG
ncbi:MAG: shikimate kinase / 3-dehydroquinate synthase [Chthoniobacter sp.]|jgi:shikimate kinase|nr:shikimate kinase / 3-dehydroquinate synthase [Chthoniobacter sp.]